MAIIFRNKFSDIIDV